jgi:TonB family protein
MIIKMSRDTLSAGFPGAIPPPPPPPPPVNENGARPLLVIDGEINTIDISSINPENIQSMTVLKGESATRKYGEKGKDGVIEITLKKDASKGGDSTHPEVQVRITISLAKAEKDTFQIVERLPGFPGGNNALLEWIKTHIKYPDDATKAGKTGQVMVIFKVTTDGKIKEVSVDKSLYPSLDAEAVRVVSSMPDWEPAIQGGKKVSAWMKLPVEFKKQQGHHVMYGYRKSVAGMRVSLIVLGLTHLTRFR